MFIKKLKAVHIHTDHKFVYTTKMFEGNFFSNTSIVIQSNKKYDKREEANILLLENSNKGIQKIIDICADADLVVLYDLNLIKQRIVLKLPEDIKVAWRFFGYELYGKKPEVFKSKLSLKYDDHRVSLKKILKKLLGPIYSFLKYGQTHKSLFNNAIKRVDFLIALSQEEYQFLKIIWPKLPEFIRIPHYHSRNAKVKDFDFDGKIKEQRPIIILGNNRLSFNNHLELINIVEKYENKINYNFTLLFSYGPEKVYTSKIRESVKNKNYFTLVDQFIPKEEFAKFYKKSTALVINGYRQMAGANIRMAFQNGTKVYLNDNNAHKDFLENEGFKIFSIKDFETDLKNDSLYPDLKTAKHNFENFKKFIKRYTIEDFQERIFERLMNKNNTVI